MTYFETTGEWQDLEFRVGDLYPTFRGRKLDRPDFDHDSIEEIRFLIGNKRPESFKLLIDKIELVEE
ncbi:CIA30 family protein [Rhodohalobacter sp.]|uniref:CIA30 family protein n=1 Tax=Rhodohalobacter sp. TaxID=1974210 RepID=UPI003A0FBCA5